MRVCGDAERCGSPEVLRVFHPVGGLLHRRHDRELFADLGGLTFDIVGRFFCQAAGRSLRCAMDGETAPRQGLPARKRAFRPRSAERRGHRA